METQAQTTSAKPLREPWNKGKLIGQKPPLRAKHVWSIRTRLQMEGRSRVLNGWCGGEVPGFQQLSLLDIGPRGWQLACCRLPD